MSPHENEACVICKHLDFTIFAVLGTALALIVQQPIIMAIIFVSMFGEL